MHFGHLVWNLRPVGGLWADGMLPSSRILSLFAICFANALGNAIECCEKLPEEKRKIIFHCIGKPKLMFEIKNPQPDRITFGRNGLPRLPEGGMETRVRSIVAFCEKYDAFYSFTAENGWFKLTITL